MSGKALATTLAMGLLAILPAQGQDLTSKEELTQPDSVAGGAEGHSSPDGDNAKQWIRRLAADQRDLWTSPDRVRSNDTRIGY